MTERLQVSFPGGQRVDVRIGEFDIKTDQSQKFGGEASAPQPFDLFLASLATCAGIFALKFCESRKLPTEGLGLTMLWDRGEKQSPRAHATLQLRLPAGFPPKYQEGIVRAMDLCAVKKQIENPPEFVTEILN